MQITWRLRMAAAQREVWTGSQLRRLLAEKAGLELSSASVSALDCTPNDLFDIDTTPVPRPAGGSPAGAAATATAASGGPGRGRSMPPL